MLLVALNTYFPLLLHLSPVTGRQVLWNH